MLVKGEMGRYPYGVSISWAGSYWIELNVPVKKIAECEEEKMKWNGMEWNDKYGLR
jgi:hypothetical protein